MVTLAEKTVDFLEKRLSRRGFLAFAGRVAAATGFVLLGADRLALTVGGADGVLHPDAEMQWLPAAVGCRRSPDRRSLTCVARQVHTRICFAESMRRGFGLSMEPAKR
jgi:hypothetical protein